MTFPCCFPREHVLTTPAECRTRLAYSLIDEVVGMVVPGKQEPSCEDNSAVKHIDYRSSRGATASDVMTILKCIYILRHLCSKGEIVLRHLCSNPSVLFPCVGCVLHCYMSALVLKMVAS